VDRSSLSFWPRRSRGLKQARTKGTLLIYIIYGSRTILGFVGFVANLLNRATDGVRKSASKKSYFSSVCEYVKLLFSLMVPKKFRFNRTSTTVYTSQNFCTKETRNVFYSVACFLPIGML
jgi:hypothetical protein